MRSAVPGILRTAVARAVVATGIALVVVAGAGGVAHGDAPTDPSLYAVTRDRTGTVTVVHGDAAVQAYVDTELGRGHAPVVNVGHDAPVSALSTNDPLRSLQWALDRTSFEPTWPTTTGAGVTVAVLDTGVYAAHEDLSGVVLAGASCVTGACTSADPGQTDPNGHGTHVAGIIAAIASNGLGIAGGAPGARILPVRVLDATGSGVSSAVTAGIYWATDHGARVISMSLGGGEDDGMRTAIQYANSKGAVVLAAAGNNCGGCVPGQPSTCPAPLYPAAFPEAIAVGAVDSTLVRASFSNCGTYLGVVAPGVGIVSAWPSSPSSYASASGTSMATPYAAAAAALVVAANPSLSAGQVKQDLESTATDLGAPGPDAEYGSGLIDPRSAVNLATKPANAGTQGNGYWVVTAEGAVRAFGSARALGDLSGVALSAPIVASARTPDANGYWLVGADGAVYAFGDAPYLGAMNGRPLNAPIVGMAATPGGHGYILLAADGGIFAFGDAGFYGSTGNLRPNAPILDLAITPSGRGYWFVGADGGVFSYGDAQFHGSTGNLRLAAPVVSMTAGGTGYWAVALDGGIFAFGVPFQGSIPGLRAPGVEAPWSKRMRAVPDGSGYYVMGVDGSIYTFGSARFFGAAPGSHAVDLMLAP